MSRYRLAKLTGIGQGVLHRIEHGAIAKPAPDKLARIAQALGLPTADLFGVVGYTTADDLPSLSPYLRTKYGHLPPPVDGRWRTVSVADYEPSVHPLTPLHR